MELKDRIAAIMKQTSLNTPAFAKHIGVKTSQAIYDLLSGKTKTLSSDILVKIMACFPQLSAEWLVTGDGDMITGSVAQYNQNGDNINGHSVSVKSAEIDKLIELLQKKDEQIDRLLSLLEKFNNKN